MLVTEFFTGEQTFAHNQKKKKKILSPKPEVFSNA